MMQGGEARLSDQCKREPGVDEFLAEPIVRMLMRRDGIAPDDARRLFAAVSRRLSSQGTGRDVRAAMERARAW
jgi:hypothetical protein